MLRDFRNYIDAEFRAGYYAVEFANLREYHGRAGLQAGNAARSVGRSHYRELSWNATQR